MSLQTSFVKYFCLDLVTTKLVAFGVFWKKKANTWKWNLGLKYFLYDLSVMIFFEEFSVCRKQTLRQNPHVTSSMQGSETSDQVQVVKTTQKSWLERNASYSIKYLVAIYKESA